MWFALCYCVSCFTSVTGCLGFVSCFKSAELCLSSISWLLQLSVQLVELKIKSGIWLCVNVL